MTEYCGEAPTDHRWHINTAAGLTLACRHCDAIWNPAEPARGFALIADALVLELDKMAQAARVLAQAIRDHRDSKGHDRCWLNDLALYRVLGEPIPDPGLPARGLFLEGCAAYIDGMPEAIPEGSACARCEGSHVYEADGRALLCKPHVLG